MAGFLGWCTSQGIDWSSISVPALARFTHFIEATPDRRGQRRAGSTVNASLTASLFQWDYNKAAVDYEERLLAGRYVLTTSLTPAQASTAEVVAHYQSLANVEHRFRVMKDFLGLRPVFHWTEQRVKGHIAICVLAAVIEAVIANNLDAAGIEDPNLEGQTITPRRALAEFTELNQFGGM